MSGNLRTTKVSLSGYKLISNSAARISLSKVSRANYTVYSLVAISQIYFIVFNFSSSCNSSIINLYKVSTYGSIATSNLLAINFQCLGAKPLVLKVRNMGPYLLK